MKKLVVAVLVAVIIIGAIGAYYLTSMQKPLTTLASTSASMQTTISTQSATPIKTITHSTTTEGPYQTTTASTLAGQKISGRIIQKGSDTLLILAQRWAEEFMANPQYSEVQISVSGGGSGAGIAALINGEIDMADLSREIKHSEIDQAKKNGVEPVEWKVAIDGITIIVNKNNPIDEISLDQLGAIYKGNFRDWSELVSNYNGKIIAYGRQSNSGTYVFMKEHVLKNVDYRDDLQAMNGNADIVEAVARDKTGIGYVGYAYAEQRKDEIKIVKIKTSVNLPAIEPTISNISDGSYPLSRYLYIYTNGIPKEPAASYLRFIISDEGQKITQEVECIPITEDIQQEQLNNLK
ncbi:MAG: PstS family phosphate ABC transporter substrate-binding protein [Candidatus Bathyarchaeia archaeon]